MPYLVAIHETFDEKANADHVFNQALSVATNSSVARIGQPGERTSHGAVYFEAEDGSLTIESQFHKDRFGIVRRGTPVNNDIPPLWIQPTGSQDAYPALDVYGNPTVVTLNSNQWRNDHGDGNVWVPGSFSGWVQI